MLRNYLTTILRSFRRNTTYLALNVLGLALGIGCSVVIFKVVSYELSFDAHHANYDHIYRVVSGESASVPHPLGDALVSDYSFIDAVAKLDYEGGGLIASWADGKQLHKYNEDEGLVFASPGIFDVFSFPSITGDLRQALTGPNTAVISDAWAQRYFDCSPGDYECALGKTITVNFGLEVVIRGVFEAPPATTDFPFQLMVHYDNLGEYDRDFAEGKDWTSTSSATNCYVLLREQANAELLEESMPGLLAKYYEGENDGQNPYLLQPLADVHFNPAYLNYSYKTMDYKLVVALAGVGFFLLVAACINFVNLATAQARKRAREIGIRKVLGGHRRQLQWQFLLETLLVSAMACFLSLAVAEILFVQLKDILGYQLSIGLAGDPGLAIYLLTTLVVVTLLAGMYPSLVLSRLNAVGALRSQFAGGKPAGGLSLRKLLVVVQFVISQGLVICTLIVFKQVTFVQNQPLGFDKEAVLMTYVVPGRASLATLGEELRSIAGVEKVSFCAGAPLSSSNSSANFYDPGVDAGLRGDMNANFKAVDEDYLSLFGLELVAGRNIRKSDSARAVVVTEQVVRMLGYQTPADAIGARLKTGYDDVPKEVVGVIRDFHAYSLHRTLEPVILLYSPAEFESIAIRVAGTETSVAGIDQTIKSLGEVWATSYPEFVFDYRFLDESIAAKYRQEKNLGTLFLIFAVVALLIGALGLYGLITYVTSERMKEVGIRKVLGASTLGLIVMFNREVVVLLLVSMMVVAPVTYFAMHEWMANFAYQAGISYLTFLAGGLVSLFFTLLSTGYKSFDAARVNPVDLLRSE